MQQFKNSMGSPRLVHAIYDNTKGEGRGWNILQSLTSDVTGKEIHDRGNEPKDKGERNNGCHLETWVETEDWLVCMFFWICA